MKKMNENKGFTLAELLIVVAVIAVLVAVAIPTFADQLEKARQAVDVSNLRGAYAAAKLAAMDGKIGDEKIAEDTYYYYDPDVGSLTNASDANLTKTAYGKATSKKALADTSNLSGEIVYDTNHLATNDRYILVSFNIANTVPSIKLISFEKGDVNTLDAYSSSTSGTIKSIDGAFNYTNPASNNGSAIALDTNATVIVTTDKGKYAAKLSDLGTDGTKAKVSIDDAAADNISNVTFTAHTDEGNSITHTVTIIGQGSIKGSATFTVVIPAKT